MSAPRRRIVRPPNNSRAATPKRQRQLDRVRAALARERAALARWQRRMRRAFHAVQKAEQRIARLERQLARLGPEAHVLEHERSLGAIAEGHMFHADPSSQPAGIDPHRCDLGLGQEDRLRSFPQVDDLKNLNDRVAQTPRAAEERTIGRQ